MEFVAPQTARAHEHESRRAFARSAPQHRYAMHSGQALSAGSRPDYQKSDRECHADFSKTVVRRDRATTLPTSAEHRKIAR